MFTKDDWIDLEENFPNENTPVLLCDIETGTVGIGTIPTINKQRTAVIKSAVGCPMHISHWAPLPPLPNHKKKMLSGKKHQVPKCGQV